MKFLLGIISLVFFMNVSAQLNMDSISHVNYFSLHSTMINDIWGYEDEFGNEYALVGTENGTSVVDISTPTNPVEVFWEPGMNSVWRDLKTYGDYAYVTTEAQNGLLIIDLSPLPGSTALTTTYYTGPGGDQWDSAHNIYIDEFGYAYIFGANRDNGGVIILDVATDPLNPIEVGTFDDWYAHDGMAQDNILYLAHISDGFISIVDVADKANPVLLGTKATPSTFSHNIWVTANGQYAFTTDEVSGAYLAAYDVSDPTDIIELDRIQSSPGAGVIPHNTHVIGNHIVTSYYSDGVVVHDVTHPYNMIEVGNYDTYPGQTTSYDGCWGAYPYFTSGIVLATDRSEGLFILNPTYVQAAYLEGTITNSVTTNPLDQVEIEIVGGNQLEYTSNTGFYATGIATGGVYDVVYSKVGYFPQTLSLTLTNGVITTQDIQLVPISPYNLDILVVEEGTGTPIANADVRLQHTFLTHDGITNGIGEESLTLYYEDLYNVQVGKWGYITHCFYENIDNSTGTIVVTLRQGIYDDFAFDFGWASSGTAVTGLWERGKPNGTSSGSAPSEDVTNDCGEYAYVTGNSDNLHPNADDVDLGTAILTSPVMDLTGYTEPYVNYSRWFYNEFGPGNIDDTLRVSVSNGTQTVEIDKIGKDPGTFFQWVIMSIRLSDHISITSTMQFFFHTSDLDPHPNITEAGLDKFYIVEEAELGVIEQEVIYSIYPNPFDHKLVIDGIQTSTDYTLVSSQGRVVDRGVLLPNQNELMTTEFKSGIYFLHLDEKVYKVIKLD